MTSKALLTLTAALLLGQVTFAHHSWAGFSSDATTTEGRIEEVKVVNPHVTIQFRGDDGERYTVIWQAPQAPQALARRGFYVEGQGGLKDLLTPGDRLRSLELRRATEDNLRAINERRLVRPALLRATRFGGAQALRTISPREMVAPGRIRTCGLWLRRPVRYPGELLVCHCGAGRWSMPLMRASTLATCPE